MVAVKGRSFGRAARDKGIPCPKRSVLVLAKDDTDEPAVRVDGDMEHYSRIWDFYHGAAPRAGSWTVRSLWRFARGTRV